MKIVGTQRVQYTSKRTGKPVSGYQVHGITPFSSGRGDGYAVETIYLSDTVLEGRVPALNNDLIFAVDGVVFIPL